MPGLGDLIVKIGANVSEFQAGMAGVSSTLGKVASEVETKFAGFENFGSKLGSAGLALSALFAAPAAVLGSSIHAFADFDSAMAKSLAVQEGVTESMRTRLSSAAIELSKNLSVSAKDAAASLYFLASAGFTVDQQIASLPVVANFAKAGLVSVNDAAAILTRSQFALGLSSQDAAINTKNLAMIADVLVKADTLALGKTQEFADALTNKGATAMKTFGISLRDGISILAAYSQAGIRGQEAGTYFEMMIRQFTQSISKHGQAWRDLGVAVYDSSGKMRSPIDILSDLQLKLGGMSDQAKAAQINLLGIQARAQFAILPLLGLKDTIADLRTKFADFGGTSERVAQNQMKTFSEEMQIAWNRITALRIVIGGALVPSLETLGGALNPVLHGVESAAHAFQELPKFMQVGIVASAALAVGAGLSSAALLVMAGGAMTLVSRLAPLAALMTSTLIPAAGSVVTAITGSGAVVASFGAAGIAAGALAVIFGGAIGIDKLLTWLENLDRKLDDTFERFDKFTKRVSTMADVAKAVGKVVVISGEIVPAGDINAQLAHIERLKEAQAELTATIRNTASVQVASNKSVSLSFDEVSKYALASGPIFKNSAQIMKEATTGIDISGFLRGVSKSTGEVVQSQAELEKAYKQAQKTYTETQRLFKLGAASIDDVKRAMTALQDAAAKAHPELHGTGVALTDVKAGAEGAAASHKALNKATSDLHAAQTTLADALRLIYVPLMTDVKTAEEKLQASRAEVVRSTDILAAAEVNLASIQKNSPGNTAALVTGEKAVEAARVTVKTASDAYRKAEKDLAQAKSVSKDVTNALASADSQYAVAMKAVHEPALRNYEDALKDVTAAKANVIQSANAMREAEDRLATLEEQRGSKSQIEMAAAHDALTEANNRNRIAIEDLRQKESDLVTSQHILHSANTELMEDAKALDVLYKNSLTGSIKGFIESLDGVRTAKDQVTAASVKLMAAEQALKAAVASGDAQATYNADKRAIEAREGLRLATNELSTAEQFLQSKYGVTKPVIDALTNDTNGYSKSVQNTAAALSSLGITSTIVLQKLASDSKTSYDLIAASGAASVNQKRDAQIVALHDEKALQIAAGRDLTREQQATLDHLLNQQEYFNRRHLDQWHTLYSSITGIVSGTINKATDALVSGVFGGNDKQNQQLDKQAEKLKDSLGDQAATLQTSLESAKSEYEAFVGDTNTKLAALNGDYLKATTAAQKESISRQIQDLNDSLVDKERKYQASVAKLKDGYQKYVEDTKQQLADLKRQHVTVWSQIADLVTGPQGVFAQITKSFVTTLIQPMTDAIAHFIATSVAELLGGKGFGGILSSIKGIGTSITSVFGGGLSAIGGLGPGGTSGFAGPVGTILNDPAVAANAGLSLPSAAGSAASAGGSAASGIGGLLGTVSSFANIANAAIGAASGIVTGFQLSHIGSDVNFIEKSTRFAWLTLGGGGANTIVENTLKTSQYTMDIRDRISSLRDALFDPIATHLEEINTSIKRFGSGLTPAVVAGGDNFTFAIDMRGSNFSTPASAARATEDMARRVAEMVESRRGRKGPSR